MAWSVSQIAEVGYVSAFSHWLMPKSFWLIENIHHGSLKENTRCVQTSVDSRMSARPILRDGRIGAKALWTANQATHQFHRLQLSIQHHNPPTTHFQTRQAGAHHHTMQLAAGLSHWEATSVQVVNNTSNTITLSTGLCAQSATLHPADTYSNLQHQV